MFFCIPKAAPGFWVRSSFSKRTCLPVCSLLYLYLTARTVTSRLVIVFYLHWTVGHIEMSIAVAHISFYLFMKMLQTLSSFACLIGSCVLPTCLFSLLFILPPLFRRLAIIALVSCSSISYDFGSEGFSRLQSLTSHHQHLGLKHNLLFYHECIPIRISMAICTYDMPIL